MVKLAIFQKGKTIRKPFFLYRWLSYVSCYVCVISLALIDISATQFQYIYFGFYDIPKIKRSDYFTYDRFDLKKLSWQQKVACTWRGANRGGSSNTTIPVSS